MTRKDYQIIAAALAATRNKYDSSFDKNLFRACDDHVTAIADALNRDNTLFNRGAFLAACGMKAEA